jgi:hypothetical protein
MSASPERVRITCNLTDDQAWQLAQFVKRIGFNDVRANATNDDEAYHMLDAIDQLQRALAAEGYNPR